jgi:hypothetical protein
VNSIEAKKKSTSSCNAACSFQDGQDEHVFYLGFNPHSSTLDRLSTMHVSVTRKLLLAVYLATVTPSVLLAQEASSVKLIKSVNLPGYTGDFDHFAVDYVRKRLLLAAEDHGTLEVFDLQPSAHPRSVAGFGTPAGGLLYGWLAAFNQASYPALGNALPNVALASAAAAQIQLRQQTGGFNLLSAKEVQPGVLVFRLRDQTPSAIEAPGTLQGVRTPAPPPSRASASAPFPHPARTPLRGAARPSAASPR